MSEAQPLKRREGSEAVPGLPTERLKPRTFLILITAAFGIGGTIVYGIPELRERLHKREAGKLVHQASSQLASGDWEAANKTIGRALKITPQDPDALRVAAKTLEQTPGSTEQAVIFWRQLVQIQKATPDDAIAYATCLLRDGSRDQARKILDSIPAPALNTRAALELKAAFLQADGQTDAADKMLREAYLNDSENPESLLKLASLDLSSPFLEVQEAAAKNLWRIAQSGGTESANAMRVLATQTRLSAPQAAAMQKILAKTPNASDERRLTIATGLLRALPAERENIIVSEAVRQQGRPFEDTTAFMRWLAMNGENKRLLSLLPANQAVRSGNLFLPFVSAMEQTGRWKELRDIILKNPTIPIPPARIALILARCAQSLKESSERVRSQLQDGLHQATIAKDRQTMIAIGNTADEFGQPDLAIEAFSLLAAQPQFKLPMLERILLIRQRQRDLPAMIEIIDRCLKEQPKNPAYIEASCYLKLLDGSEMEKAAETIRRHVEDNPERVPTASLIRAFAAYRFGDLESAEREARSVVTSKLPPGQRAVLAGILQACGHESEAFRLAEKIPETIVLAEEKRLLKTAY